MKKVKLEWRESNILSGSMAYDDELVVFPGEVYEFTEEKAVRALKDFPSNFFIVGEPTKQKHQQKKEIKDETSEDKSLKAKKTKTK